MVDFYITEIKDGKLRKHHINEVMIVYNILRNQGFDEDIYCKESNLIEKTIAKIISNPTDIVLYSSTKKYNPHISECVVSYQVNGKLSGVVDGVPSHTYINFSFDVVMSNDWNFDFPMDYFKFPEWQLLEPSKKELSHETNSMKVRYFEISPDIWNRPLSFDDKNGLGIKEDNGVISDPKNIEDKLKSLFSCYLQQLKEKRKEKTEKLSSNDKKSSLNITPFSLIYEDNGQKKARPYMASYDCQYTESFGKEGRAHYRFHKIICYFKRSKPN